MEELKRLLALMKRGDIEAAQELVPLVYDEMRQIATGMMMHERPGHTLQPTALANEAYLRLIQGDGALGTWNSPAHFFSAAAQAMRRILVESARRKKAQKRGAGADHTQWDDSKGVEEARSEDLLKLDEALTQLEAENETLAALVQMKYFGGFTVPEIAVALGVSERQVNRNWTAAKAWLRRQMERED